MRYSASEIAAICNISTASFYNWIKKSAELRRISNLEKEFTVVNGTNTASFGEETLNAFIAEAIRRGKSVRQDVDKGSTTRRQSENQVNSGMDTPSSESTDEAQSKDTQVFDKASQALIDELKSQNEYLKQKLDDALEDNRNYAQAMVRMSANIILLQSENQRLIEAHIHKEEPETTETEQKPSIWQKIRRKWGKK